MKERIMKKEKKNAKKGFSGIKKETGMGIFMAAAFAFMLLAYPEMAAFASAADTISAKFTSFYDMIAGIVSSIGMIFTLWGVSEWGVAFQSSEGTMQSQAFKKIAGGLIMSLAPQIVTIII